MSIPSGIAKPDSARQFTAPPAAGIHLRQEPTFYHPSASSSALALFYFLSVLAIIILVLGRARGEVASLKEFNERLVDGLGEGLELIDEEFTIRHANRWMSQQFGPVVGRRCYEVLTANQQPCPGCPLVKPSAMEATVRVEIAGPDDRRFLLTYSPVRQADLEAVKTEARRLNTTLSDFLLFARPCQPTRQAGNIGKVVEHVSALPQDERNGRGGMQVAVQVEPSLPRFAFDAHQLTQVLWNIARNGVEAMQGRGHLTPDVGRRRPRGLASGESPGGKRLTA